MFLMRIRTLSYLFAAASGQQLCVVDAFAPRSLSTANGRGKPTIRLSNGAGIITSPFLTRTNAWERIESPNNSCSSIPARLSSSDNSFDISKPTFDLYTLRSIRGDALLRYNSLNQSEPLRINLYLLLMLSLFSYPAISEAVVGEPATLLGTAAATLGGSFCAYRFVRECGRRSRKLNRMEKELNAELLALRLPGNRFADRPYGEEPVQLRQLRGSRRVLAICGSADQLREAMVPFRALRRRFVQASALVVAVPTDGSSAKDWGIEMEELRSVPYLAETVDAREWVEYFGSLVGSEEGNADSLDGKLAWFGLTNTGKSFGSGAGNPPRLIEVLGQSLLPVELLDEVDKAESGGASNGASSDAVAAIFEAQKQFYDALTSGDLPRMTSVYGTENSNEVDEVLGGGGEIDGWEKCLADGARPSGMKISGSDVLVLSDTEAYSTAIEFPPVTGFDSASLLAVQQWGRNSVAEEWKLQLHQTIPWSPDSRAGATLRCDCRGCTALSRGQERQWNFRGMID